ncbi:FtsJ-like methyltransferase-domain-containing protein [Gorgonomyces haynaldii]|nr:FtsJ-like methyltransferase-domain-containing protein [Gorgonomyces haynaldii]
MEPKKRPKLQVPLIENVRFVRSTTSPQDLIPHLLIKTEPASVDVCSDFMDTITQQDLKNYRKQSGEVPKQQYETAKRLMNPFELLGNSIFQNRGATKMANLEHLCQLLPQRNFQFVDICGGPGGFSEYVLWRMGIQFKVRGFGITLTGPQDYRLKSSRFTINYGQDGSGDITNLSNNQHFVDSTKKLFPSVDLALADGAFSVLGDEKYQEHHQKHLLLAESLIVLQVLNKGGNAVIKLFETTLPFTIQLIYLLCAHFETYAIVKPFSSRPANTERYLVLKSFKGTQDEITKHLQQCLQEYDHLFQKLQTTVSSHTQHPPGMIPWEEKTNLGLLDLTTIIEPKEILNDSKFVDWIEDMNLLLAMRQIDALKSILNNLDTEESPYEQQGIAHELLVRWKLRQARR